MSKRGKYYGRQYGVSEGDRAQAAIKRRLEKPAEACKVWGCTNTTHDAKFIGIMCAPCWEFLVSGRVTALGRNFQGVGGAETTTPGARQRLREVREMVGMGKVGAGDV